MPEITSGESVEQIAHDIAHHVLRNLVELSDEIEGAKLRIEDEPVWIYTADQVNEWLTGLRGNDELIEAIAARIREHTGSRTVTTAGGLDALADRSVVIDSDGEAYQKDNGEWYAADSNNVPVGRALLVGYGPLTVIYEPGDES